jgi:hypothetical protein
MQLLGRVLNIGAEKRQQQKRRRCRDNNADGDVGSDVSVALVGDLFISGG